MDYTAAAVEYHIQHSKCCITVPNVQQQSCAQQWEALLWGGLCSCPLSLSLQQRGITMHLAEVQLYLRLNHPTHHSPVAHQVTPYSCKSLHLRT
jgi:hypothetical protein